MPGFAPLGSGPLGTLPSAAPPDSMTVTGVTLSPTSATGAVTFTATVAGPGSPSQAVTWSTTGGGSAAGGAFVPPAATSALQAGTVVATSVQDPRKSATATWTVAAIGAPADTTGPVMGQITATATSNSIAWAWAAATDPSGIGAYFVSLNGAAPASNALSRTLDSLGLAASTPYTLTVTAIDTRGNLTSTPRTLTVSTLAAAVTPPDPVPGAGLATTVTFSVVDAGGNAVPDQTGLDFAFFDQLRLKDVQAPVVKGSSFAIIAGKVTFSIAGLTSLTPGQYGRIQWETADGAKAGGGRVVVS